MNWTRKDFFSHLVTLCGGQVSSAILSLVTVKLVVTWFPIHAYCLYMLLLGTQTFLNLALVSPLQQAAILYHEEFRHTAQQRLLRMGSIRIVQTLALIALLPVCIFSHKSFNITIWESITAAAFVSFTLLTDATKTLNINVIHSHEQHRRYTLWTLLDSASKPVLIALCTLSGEHNYLLLLGAHATASGLMAWLTSQDPLVQSTFRATETAIPPNPLQLLRSHFSFLWPLALMGVVAWVNALLDRYLLNARLGPNNAGIYAGLYGLFSAPFLLSFTGVTLLIRPRMLNLFSQHHEDALRRFFWNGFFALVPAIAGLALSLWWFRSLLIRICLSSAFLKEGNIAGGIIMGHALLVLGYHFDLAFCVQKKTGLLLAKRCISGSFALLVLPPMIARWGMTGAAWACPIYFGADMLAGMLLVSTRLSNPLFALTGVTKR